MKNLSLLSLSLLLLSACNANNLTLHENKNQEVIVENTIEKKPQIANINIPDDTSQLLVVTTANWSTKDGKLQRYQKANNHWQKVGDGINIVLGKNGLGWGKGLHRTPKNAPYVKQEGDGKAPAGLFSLNNGFGYNQTNFKMNFPYADYKVTDHCVDDSNSKWYNQIINSKEIKKDYKSFEHMKLSNNLYKYGITVNHNPKQITQAGSCIFIHIKNKSGKGTAGCTAMHEDEIITILKWLKGEEKPLLLQLPEEEMVKVKLN